MRLKISSLCDMLFKTCRCWYQEVTLMRRLRSDYLRISVLPYQVSDLWEKGENILLWQVMRETGER